MKRTIDDILTDTITFEPSERTKKLILKSLKESKSITIGGEKELNLSIPGLISYDLTKYNHYGWFVILLYMLEGLAAISILIITDDPVYMFFKLFLVLILALVDIMVARHSASKDNIFNLSRYWWEFYELMLRLYRTKLSLEQKKDIDDNKTKKEKEINDVNIFKKWMLLLLYFLGLLKIIVFYLDYIIDGFNWGEILTSPIGFIICFFGAPIAYLVIPILGWKFYGKWIWTGDAIKKLEIELAVHKAKIDDIERGRGFGEINYCNKLDIDIPMNLHDIIEHYKETLKINEKKDNDIIKSKDNIAISPKKGNRWIINKQDEDSFANFYGLLTDSELIWFVNQQTNSEAKQLCLIMGMSNQASQIQRDCDKKDQKNFDEFRSQIYTIESLNAKK
jgi:hypothetical protein